MTEHFEVSHLGGVAAAPGMRGRAQVLDQRLRLAQPTAPTPVRAGHVCAHDSSCRLSVQLRVTGLLRAQLYTPQQEGHSTAACCQQCRPCPQVCPRGAGNGYKAHEATADKQHGERGRCGAKAGEDKPLHKVLVATAFLEDQPIGTSVAHCRPSDAPTSARTSSLGVRFGSLLCAGHGLAFVQTSGDS